jgi:hypothetical protein
MFRTWWSRWRKCVFSSQATFRRDQRIRFQCERLEDRTVPSTFVWTNRGNSILDSDGFNAVFAGNAATARAVVDAALSSWQNIISNFNFANGSNTFTLTISTNPSALDNGATAWTGVLTDGHGRPTGGTIQIDAGTDGHGGGWYLDANPSSSAFNGNQLNPYARDATPGGPAVNKGDLMMALNHEILHTLGLVSNPVLALMQNANGYLRNTGQPDKVDSPGTLFTFTGPDVLALLTSDEAASQDLGRAEHMAAAGNTYVDPVTHLTYNGSVDAVNPRYMFGRRVLPSLTDVLILKDAYGYTVNNPPSFWTPTSSHTIATGVGAGQPPLVQVFDTTTGNLVFSFAPYDSSFTNGVRVAMGYIFGSGSAPAIVTAPGPGSPPLVRVFNGATGALVLQFYAFDPSINVGVTIAVGNVSGDGYADIVTGTSGGNPDVRVFSGKDIATGTFNAAGSSMLAHWFSYGVSFNVGANVAVGDVNGDGYADIVTGATAGNPHVKVYSGRDIALGIFNSNNPDNSLLAQFFPYALQFNVGANVAVGNIDGNGFADIVTGATTGNPDVRVYRGREFATGTFSNANPGGSQEAQWFAYGLQFNEGVNISVCDINGDGYADIITGTTSGTPHVKVYDGKAVASGTLNPAFPDSSILVQFFALSQFNNGVYVAGAG